jgi:hypothetical protein
LRPYLQHPLGVVHATSSLARSHGGGEGHHVGLAAAALHTPQHLQRRRRVLLPGRGRERVREWSYVATAGGIPQHGRSVSRSTQLSVLARPLTRTSPGGEVSSVYCESRVPVNPVQPKVPQALPCPLRCQQHAPRSVTVRVRVRERSGAYSARLASTTLNMAAALPRLWLTSSMAVAHCRGSSSAAATVSNALTCASKPNSGSSSASGGSSVRCRAWSEASPPPHDAVSRIVGDATAATAWTLRLARPLALQRPRSA